MRELVIQKSSAAVTVALALAFLTPLQVVICFAVLGQGHFFAAYFYQWKAGKINARWLGAFLALAIVLFSIPAIMHRYELIALATAIIFFIHHFHDEITLFGKERTLFRTLEILPPVLLYSAFASDALIGTRLVLWSIAGAAVAYCIYAAFRQRSEYQSDLLSFYLFFITGILASLWWFDVHVAAEKLIGAVILFHYVCWYVYYFFRFSGQKERQLYYVRDMAAINAIVIAAYVLWVSSDSGAMFTYVFAPVYFYLWTILHIVFSVRLSDYRALVRW